MVLTLFGGNWEMDDVSIFNESWFWILQGLVLILFAFFHIWRCLQQLMIYQLEILENIFLEKL